MMSNNDSEMPGVKTLANRGAAPSSRRKRVVWLAALLTLGVGWGITSTWGVRDVTTFFARQESRPVDGRVPQRLDFDPNVPPYRAKSMPWYYVGHASSPFPFVVAIDVAFLVGPGAGQRGRYYVFWFFGIKVPIHYDVVWVS